ncbi:MAG: hypothetical protein RJA36_587 [Pseudomonadota bacterium]|jgi:hypothetical protein
MECWSEFERVAFGRRLADARRAKQLTQDDIAVLVGQALASQSNYSVACAGGDTMMVRCEYGTCRVMQ